MRSVFTTLVAIGLLCMMSVVANPIPYPDAPAQGDSSAGQGTPGGNLGAGKLQPVQKCENIMCTQDINPICATKSDGETMRFNNPCEMNVYKCKNPGALSETYTKGECKKS